MNKTRIIHLALPLLLTLSFSSCVIYHPHNIDIPLLHEKGELAVDASVSLSAPLLGAPALNGTLSYAPLNHMGVQVAGSFSDINSFYAQAAAGGFIPMGNAVLEGYVGYGYGTSVHNTPQKMDDTHYRVDGHYGLLFGQLNLGWVNLANGIFDIGFGLKGGILSPDFDKKRVLEDGETEFMESYIGHNYLLQPQIMVRTGWKQIKFSFNMGYAYLTDWPEENNYFNYEHISIGLGVHFDF